MTCHTCGGSMTERLTDLPFKVGDQSIVIVKGLPVIQCSACNDYLIADRAMAEVERLLGAADRAAELEILRYAA